MKNMDSMKDRKFIFGSVQIAANKMDTLLERALKEYGITSKQWFLTVVVENAFDQLPTIKEAAGIMGSSHQNIKQMALKLEQKGMLVLEKDQKDARVTRLRLTEEGHRFPKTIQTKAEAFTGVLFSGINENELSNGRIMLQKMLSNLELME